MNAYPPETKAEALAIYTQHGPAAAAHQTGVNHRTVLRWAKEAGVSYDTTKKAANPEQLRRISAHQTNLAERLYTEAGQLLDQLHEPVAIKKVVTLSGGRDSPADWEVATIDLDEPTFSDQKQILTSAAIAIDKAQLLAGEATDRTEQHRTSRDAEDARSRVDEALEKLSAEHATKTVEPVAD